MDIEDLRHLHRLENGHYAFMFNYDLFFFSRISMGENDRYI